MRRGPLTPSSTREDFLAQRAWYDCLLLGNSGAILTNHGGPVDMTRLSANEKLRSGIPEHDGRGEPVDGGFAHGARSGGKASG
jgi:hypothetical protein